MMTLKSDLLDKIKKIKTGGLPYVLRGLKRFIFGKKEIIDIYVLDIKNKTVGLPKEACRAKREFLGESFEIKILYPGDVSYYNEFLEFAKKKIALTNSDIETILKKSIRFIALLNKRIVAITCLASHEYPLDELEFNFILGMDQGYRFKAFVDEEHRRKGIISLLWDYELDFAINKGYKYLISAIRQWNKASYIPHLKMGYEKYATAILTEHFFIQQHKIIKAHNSNKDILSLYLFSGERVKI